LKVLKGHTGNVRQLAFSADGKTLASAGDHNVDKTAIVWDMATSKARITVAEEHGVWSLAISPDGKTLATGSLRLTLWNAGTGKEIAVIKEGSPNGNGEAFSPDGKILAYGTDTNRAILWDLSANKPQLELKGHPHSVVCTAFSANGKVLVSGDHEGWVKLWDLPGGMERHTIKAHDERVTRVAISPNGQLLATGSEFGTAKLWDTATGKELANLKGIDTDVLALAFTPDSNFLLVGSRGNSRSKTPGRLALGDVKTHKLRATIPGDTHTGAAALTADGKLLAAGQFDNSIKVWEMARILESLGVN
jgi:WD40 repeat protein